VLIIRIFMSKVILKFQRDGPILVVKDGKVLMALCRCGASTNKPYCSGKHAEIRFRAEETEIEI